MPGLILTGPLGVGKTITQRRLVAEFGFWTPATYTTRQVEQHDVGFVHVSVEDFESGVADGRYVMPAWFGGAWYGWLTADLHRISNPTSGNVVLNVRPYTALLLAAFVPSLIPVWLWTDADELTRRRPGRGAVRDTDQTAHEREAQDVEDQAYGSLFRIKVKVDESVIPSLLELLAP